MSYREKIDIDSEIKQQLKEEFLNSGKPRKILAELRRPKINFKSEPNFLKRFFWRLKEDSQFFRSTVQIVFALLVIWIGIEFYIFMRWGESSGQATYFERPPGVEGFLSISALIGYISEALWVLGEKIFRKNLIIPKFLDYPLRSLKYLLLGFFVWAIFGAMDVLSLKAFIYSPYNKVADIKMYQFFANISQFSFWTILILVMFSVVIKNFWCRYLCPYGALLGILGWLSPIKIKRNLATCIDCDLCTKACPSNIKVHKVKTVWSDECTSCLECVQACPVKNTLGLKTHFTDMRVANWVFASLIIGVFVGVTGLAMLTGNWQNKISKEEYLKRFKELDKPIYKHFGGQVPDYGPND